jgi:hypothetical protein
MGVWIWSWFINFVLPSRLLQIRAPFIFSAMQFTLCVFKGTQISDMKWVPFVCKPSVVFDRWNYHDLEQFYSQLRLGFETVNYGMSPASHENLKRKRERKLALSILWLKASRGHSYTEDKFKVLNITSFQFLTWPSRVLPMHLLLSLLNNFKSLVILVYW